jgi:hypothetical protein
MYFRPKVENGGGGFKQKNTASPKGYRVFGAEGGIWLHFRPKAKIEETANVRAGGAAVHRTAAAGFQILLQTK